MTRRADRADAPTPSAGARPGAFFLLVAALSVPFWIVGARGAMLLPGLPSSALAAFCPALAAILLCYRAEGGTGVAALLARSGDVARLRNPLWLVPALLLMPAIQALSFAAMRGLGWPVPLPQWDAGRSVALALVFLVAALGEELGWTGYALEPLQRRRGALAAALVIGAVWAAWHVVALLQAHRALDWIAWWSLATVAMRVVMVWLYDRAGRSLFAVALFHASGNLAWQIAPNLVPFYDPRFNAVLLAAVAATIVVVWRPAHRTSDD